MGPIHHAQQLTQVKEILVVLVLATAVVVAVVPVLLDPMALHLLAETVVMVVQMIMHMVQAIQ
tara:strand:+ start:105 stop:293 length:189 start_codon:yes stop_codon:yes gene_type:complete